MSVRVLTTVQTEVREITHPDAVSWNARAHTEIETGGAALVLLDGEGNKVAAYAPGCWASVEKLSEPDPEPPLLRSGTVVRIPGIDVPYVVDKGLATSGPHATLTFTTVDGRDWDDDRSEPVNAATPLANAAAEPAAYANGYSTGVNGVAEAVLSETTEPYVSVSVTGNDADEVLNVWRRCAGARSTD